MTRGRPRRHARAAGASKRRSEQRRSSRRRGGGGARHGQPCGCSHSSSPSSRRPPSTRAAQSQGGRERPWRDRRVRPHRCEAASRHSAATADAATRHFQARSRRGAGRGPRGSCTPMPRQPAEAPVGGGAMCDGQWARGKCLGLVRQRGLSSKHCRRPPLPSACPLRALRSALMALALPPFGGFQKWRRRCSYKCRPPGPQLMPQSMMRQSKWRWGGGPGSSGGGGAPCTPAAAAAAATAAAQCETYANPN